MKSLFLAGVAALLFTSSVLLPACSTKKENTTDHPSGSASSVPYVSGEVITLPSKVLHEDCELYVSVPEGYKKGDKKYPVIYALDGEYQFSIVTAAAKLLYEYNQIPECIVVGVGSKHRDRDYTPPLVAGFERPSVMSEAGGADNYLDYVEKEMLPFMEAHYRTQPYRILIGHSLGGLFAVHALRTRPSLFQAYINVEGSTWFNNGAEGTELMKYFTANPNFKGNYYWVMEKMDTSYWFPITHSLHQYFEQQKPKDLHYKFIEIEGDRHETLIYPGAYAAIKELFKDYMYQFSEATTLDDIKNHYAAVSNDLGYKVEIPEDVYAIDVDHCKQVLKDMNKAIRTCMDWIKDYPGSARARKITATTFLGMNKPDSAIKYFQESLRLNPEDSVVSNNLSKLKK